MTGTVAAAALVSVVTVVRNDRAGFLATRGSLRAQGFRGFEWIVVAGTSCDGTDGAIADAVAAGEVAHHVRGVDGGPYRGMNRGADLAAGRFLLFLNAGDRLADCNDARRHREVGTIAADDQDEIAFAHGDEA